MVLQRSIASRTNGRERRIEWIAGKNIEASFAEIPAAGRRCPVKRAPGRSIETPFLARNPILRNHGERNQSHECLEMRTNRHRAPEGPSLCPVKWRMRVHSSIITKICAKIRNNHTHVLCRREKSNYRCAIQKGRSSPLGQGGLNKLVGT